MLTHTQTATLSRARVTRRKPGQRLKKAQRRKLQQQFIDTFGTLGNVAAMEALGLSRYTLYAWLRDPDFRQRYEQKLETYQLRWDGMSDAAYEQVARNLAMMPERDLIRLLRAHTPAHDRWW